MLIDIFYSSIATRHTTIPSRECSTRPAGGLSSHAMPTLRPCQRDSPNRVSSSPLSMSFSQRLTSCKKERGSHRSDIPSRIRRQPQAPLTAQCQRSNPPQTQVGNINRSCINSYKPCARHRPKDEISITIHRKSTYNALSVCTYLCKLIHFCRFSGMHPHFCRPRSLWAVYENPVALYRAGSLTPFPRPIPLTGRGGPGSRLSSQTEHRKPAAASWRRMIRRGNRHLSQCPACSTRECQVPGPFRPGWAQNG